MKRSLHLSPQAQEDLVSIWEYTCRTWGETQANSYLDRLDAGIRLLPSNPEMGVDCSDLRNGYRKLQIESHLVFYTSSKTDLLIVRVLHSAMDAQSHLE